MTSKQSLLGASALPKFWMLVYVICAGVAAQAAMKLFTAFTHGGQRTAQPEAKPVCAGQA
jgi:hypothetical protein